MPIKVLNEFLPNAEETRLGAIKVGDTLEIDQEEGVLNVDPTSVIGLYYSNCITEIAQDVKLEIVNGNAILKAGSRVYIPAGNNNTFNLYTAEEDLTANGASLNGRFFLCFYTDGSNIAVRPESIDSKSGDTFPENPTNATKFYKSDENLMYRYDGDRKVWKPIDISIPLAIVTFTNGIAENIIQVFNGFGYIGSTVFALPGVKGLIPNGRNVDGTLKNIEFTVNKVAIHTFSSNINTPYNGRFLLNSSGRILARIGSYDSINNYNLGANGVEKLLGCSFVEGSLIEGGVIKTFPYKTTFHATDYSDFKQLDDEAVKVNGNQEINDVKTFNSTLQLKNNLSFRSYGSNDSGRLQFRAQPSDNVIRGTFAITNAYNGYDGWVSQMVARSGDLSTDGFNTLRVSEKGVEYIKEEANGNVISTHKLLDTSALTNCITEIPQDIRLELNNGTLTLKAGSKGYIPSGKNADGSNKFDEFVFTADQTYNAGDDGVFFMGLGSNKALCRFNHKSVSGSTEAENKESLIAWYDTTTNIMKRYINGAWDYPYSLPLAIITVSNGAISSIDQVFNGFGYIGSTVFALPGVKGLIPDGRNADGTLKNVEFTNPAVRTLNVSSGTYNHKIALATTGIGIYTYAYDAVKNAIYRTDTGAYYAADRLIAGDVSYTNGVITSFQPKIAFHAVDYNDKSTIVGWGMPNLATKTEYTSNGSTTLQITLNKRMFVSLFCGVYWNGQSCSFKVGGVEVVKALYTNRPGASFNAILEAGSQIVSWVSTSGSNYDMRIVTYDLKG